MAFLDLLRNLCGKRSNAKDDVANHMQRSPVEASAEDIAALECKVARWAMERKEEEQLKAQPVQQDCPTHQEAAQLQSVQQQSILQQKLPQADSEHPNDPCPFASRQPSERTQRSQDKQLDDDHQRTKEEDSENIAACSERINKIATLMEDYSVEAHPGHVPGGFVGLGGEYEDMVYDGKSWRMKEDTSVDGEACSALALLSEEDRILATRFESAGGLALCLSSSFKMADELRGIAKDILDREKGDVREPPARGQRDPGWRHVEEAIAAEGRTPEEQASMLLQAAAISEDREAIQRNVWSGVDFFHGEDGNMELVSRLEAQFAGQLVRSAKDMGSFPAVPSTSSTADPDRATSSHVSSDEENHAVDGVFDVALKGCADASELAQCLSAEDLTSNLAQPRNLGVALDLIGVYLKNYEINKAHRVLERIGPLCRDRGGVWLMKALDKTCAVRMKQHRAHDALLALQELETLVPFGPEEGWEYYDVLYRNFAWVYNALDEQELALRYSMKSVEVKKANGVPATWFDCWDLGKAHARLGQENGRRDEMEIGYQMCCKAASIQREAEASDKVTLAKIQSNVGEICMGIGDSYSLEDRQQEAITWYMKAEDPLMESYLLHTGALGTNKPLAGWQAGIVAHCMVRLQRWAEAKRYIDIALKVECSKDVTTPGSLLELVDRVTNIHTRSEDQAGLVIYWDDLDAGLGRLRARGADVREKKTFALLLQKIATMTLLADGGSGTLMGRALMLLKNAEGYLTDCIAMGDASPEPHQSGWEVETNPSDAEARGARCHLEELDELSVTVKPPDFSPTIDVAATLEEVKTSIRVLEIGYSALSSGPSARRTPAEVD